MTGQVVTWRSLVAEAAGRLAGAGVPDPDLSARWIGCQATATEGAEWLAIGEAPATERQLAAFDAMVERRAGGEPLQYVLGRWGFRTLDLFIDRRVLIPRPETEVVAEWALREVRRVAADQRAPLAVADLGTGSGAIGLAMAAEQPGLDVWLTDASPDALAVARANIAGLGRLGGSVRVVEGHWFDALPGDLVGRLAVVVSNPPYVAGVGDLEPQVADWEPIGALVADDAGMAHLRHLIDGAPRWLRPEGALVLEMAPDQVEPMVAVAADRFADVEPFRDLADRPRGLTARHPRP